MKTKRIWTIAAFMMMALFSVSFISCSNDDDDDTGSPSKTMRSLDGEWRLQHEIKVQITDAGEERVLWEDDPNDFILVFNSELQSMVYAYDENGWNKRIYSYEYDEETRTITYDRPKLFKILSISNSKLELETAGSVFNGYKNVFRQTYARISNAESLIGEIEWPIPKANTAIGIWEGYTSGVTWTLEFKGGGKGTERYISNGKVAESHSFTYSMTGKFTGILNFPDYKDGRCTFEIDGNTLRLYNEYSTRYDSFTKKE